MARTREFDPDEALDRAMRLFWQRGFADTSVRDLVAHTGVAHAGLYAEFGDKRSLYMRSLERYLAMIEELLYQDLEAPDAGLAEVEGFFETVRSAIARGRFANGCMMANTGIEFANVTGDEQQKFLDNLARVTGAFDAALRNAKKRGEIGKQADPKELAAALASTFHGIALLARAGAPLEATDRTIDAALKQLR